MSGARPFLLLSNLATCMLLRTNFWGSYGRRRHRQDSSFLLDGNWTRTLPTGRSRLLYSQWSSLSPRTIGRCYTGTSVHCINQIAEMTTNPLHLHCWGYIVLYTHRPHIFSASQNVIYTFPSKMIKTIPLKEPPLPTSCFSVRRDLTEPVVIQSVQADPKILHPARKFSGKAKTS